MSNILKDQTSTRVQAPPGGHSSNMFGTEAEQSAANKKKNMGSDIFGSNKDTVDPAPVKKTHHTESHIFGSNKDTADPAPVKKTHHTESHIFGPDPVETHHKPETLAGQYKQTQMKSNIFGPEEPTATRHVSDKNKSNIFGIGDDQNKQHTGRHGLRVGYNPISGESYTPKDNVNEKHPDSTVKAHEEKNGNTQAPENDNAKTAENGSTQTAPTNTAENDSAKVAPAKAADTQKPDNAQKGGVHTSVRVFQPPGGKSHGPLW